MLLHPATCDKREYRGRIPVCQTFFHLFSQKENKTTQCTLNTGFISLSHTGFRGFGTTCRGRPRADSYRQYRGDALKSGTRLRMLMRRKEHFEQRLRAIEHGKTGDVVIPLKEETNAETDIFTMKVPVSLREEYRISSVKTDYLNRYISRRRFRYNELSYHCQ